MIKNIGKFKQVKSTMKERKRKWESVEGRTLFLAVVYHYYYTYKSVYDFTRCIYHNRGSAHGESVNSVMTFVLAMGFLLHLLFLYFQKKDSFSEFVKLITLIHYMVNSGLENDLVLPRPRYKLKTFKDLKLKPSANVLHMKSYMQRQD